MKKTPLQDIHSKLHATMIPFHDYSMPLQYDSIMNEHRFVRKNAGLFDISHMGRFEISGDKALPFIQYVITNDADRLADKQVLYTPLCNKQGGIIDDVLVYRRDEKNFSMIVNCGNTGKDLSWLQKHSVQYQPLEIKDVTDAVSLLALQGPSSNHILETTLQCRLDSLKRFYFTDFVWDNTRITVSRTGYTGEDGFEIFVDAGKVATLWNLLLEKYGRDSLIPVGLGARDTLRLEACLLLYGNDMDETVTPLETIIDWTVKFDKDDFIGKESLLKQREKGIGRKMAGFEMIDRGIPRHSYSIVKENDSIGRVTSGSFSPSTNKNIGLCLVKTQYAGIGEEFQIQIRNNTYNAHVVKIPFYRKGK
ncbi:MAG: glycine cleavage system aminomethyltransferase GcvT [wastewater metagenome]|nr:glycine cleavage system aminomethyltransferase GcvT [Candidatus Loosdrechtia aerotolerans]